MHSEKQAESLPNEGKPVSGKEKWLRRLCMAFVLLCVVGVLVFEFLSRGAAQLFNRAMTQQTMLRGSITVEKLLADLTGHVFFENLEWRDGQNQLILRIPRGNFTVNVWDILSQNLRAKTITSLTLHDAAISLRFDENMEVDFINPSSKLNRMNEKLQKNPNEAWQEAVSVQEDDTYTHETEDARRRILRHKIEQKWRNFNRGNRVLDFDMKLDKCRIEVFVRNNHYLFNSVNLYADIDSKENIHIEGTTGGFGGTMIGDGMTIFGDVDLDAPRGPQCDMSIMFYNVDPASLGVGMNLHDHMTLSTHFDGSVSHPIGNGTVQMKSLRIPALHFSDVFGSIHYEDGMLTFTDVTANVYGGKLVAYGDYSLDTRYYNIHGRGTNLQSRIALPESQLSSAVDLEIHVESKGSARKTSYYGAFLSSDGHYGFFPFRSISGRFHDSYHDLKFYDVLIRFAAFSMYTDALRVKDGELYLDKIRVVDDEEKQIYTYEDERRSRPQDATMGES